MFEPKLPPGVNVYTSVPTGFHDYPRYEVESSDGAWKLVIRIEDMIVGDTIRRILPAPSLKYQNSAFNPHA